MICGDLYKGSDVRRPRLKPLTYMLFRWLIAALSGGALTLLIIFVWTLDRRDDLDVWHTETLEEEFTAGSEINDFPSYLALEDRLFNELDQKVYAQTGFAGQDITNRFKRGSTADPRQWARNWNRSFELGTPGAERAVLLLHGMSDSPYSLRALGQALARQGAHVVGLRLPGHGTAPSGLVGLRVDDLSAAARLGIEHLEALNPGASLEIIGYSNGAALALAYTLDALEDPGLVLPDRLVLLSPAIGISGAAALAVWQARLGTLLGLDKLAWNDILIEYDPFKYNSFAVNAGDVTYRLTVELQKTLIRLEASGALVNMPPVLSFLSAVDATVSAPAVVMGLYDRLHGEQHELVIFDVNRRARESSLLRWDPQKLLKPLGDDAQRTFTLSVISNQDPGSNTVAWSRWSPGAAEAVVEILDLAWPPAVYSLSHVAIPIPPDDPVYGHAKGAFSENELIQLGALEARGERGVLRIPSSAMLRQRWNPFHSWMLARILDESPKVEGLNQRSGGPETGTSTQPPGEQ